MKAKTKAELQREIKALNNLVKSLHKKSKSLEKNRDGDTMIYITSSLIECYVKDEFFDLSMTMEDLEK